MSCPQPRAPHHKSKAEHRQQHDDDHKMPGPGESTERMPDVDSHETMTARSRKALPRRLVPKTQVGEQLPTEGSSAPPKPSATPPTMRRPSQDSELGGLKLRLHDVHSLDVLVLKPTLLTSRGPACRAASNLQQALLSLSLSLPLIPLHGGFASACNVHVVDR